MLMLSPHWLGGGFPERKQHVWGVAKCRHGLLFQFEFFWLLMQETAETIKNLILLHQTELMSFLAQRVKCSEDILQETFIRYAEYSGKTQVDNARAFIYRIASNLATDYLRSHASRARLYAEPEEFADTYADSAPSLEQCVLSQQQLERLIQALSELPPKCRDVFIMLKLKNQSYDEVKQQLGISETMVVKYMNRALTHCRQKLDMD
jgi:RNA polymerase sigma factor (sigma-70 family)